jgi:GT2 family glycosyltransferase/glycosyltransferase involved in cell wall biosynthesis/uncharacterized coiled-coil protein SlyX
MTETSSSRNQPRGTIVCYTGQSWVSAVTEIRLKVPLGKAGFQVVQGNNFHEILIEDLVGVDFVVVQRDFPRHVDKFFAVLRQTREYKIPLIYEIDDLLFELPENHPDRMSSYYTQGLVPMLTAVENADLVTTSTNKIANFLKPNNKNIKVLQNYLVDDYWEMKTPKESVRKGEEVIVGYVGGHTHLPDLEMIVPALREVLTNNPKVHLKFFGVKPPEELLSFSLVEHFPPIDNYREFVRFMLIQEIDILVAPLVPNVFNQSKSFLKVLEYYALGIPAIFSQGPPYDSLVIHGQNGFLAYTIDDWIFYLETLIESPELRLQIAQDAQDIVKRDWLLSKHSHEWAETYGNISKIPRKIDEIDKKQERVWERVLDNQISQNYQHVNKLQANIDEKDHVIQSLQFKVRDIEEILKNLNKKIEDQENVNRTLLSQVDEKTKRALELNTQLSDKEQEIEGLRTKIVEEEQTTQELREKDARSNQIIETLESKVATQDKSIQSLNSKLTIKDRDFDTLNKKFQTLILWDAKQRVELMGIKKSLSWKFVLIFRRIRLAFIPHGSWREKLFNELKGIVFSTHQKISNRKKISEEDFSLIHSSGLFDEEWYTERYPDVAESTEDPLIHYLLWGGFEGRDPGPNFDSDWYLKSNQDVKSARINPLVHYLKYGQQEGRQSKVVKIPVIEEAKDPYSSINSKDEKISEPSKYKGIRLSLPDKSTKRVSSKENFYNSLKKALQIIRSEGLISFTKRFRKYIAPQNGFDFNNSGVDDTKEFNFSIIIPVYNAATLTKNCIEKIYQTSLDSTYEVIVVDNHSTDETEILLNTERENRINFSFYRMPHNLGFAEAINFGSKQASGNSLVILNNDTLVTVGWLDRIAETFKKDELIGIVSPVTNYVGEGPQIDPDAVDINLERIDEYAEKIEDRDFEYESSRLVFFCVAIKKEVWDVVGSMDGGYEKGNYEDNDYCMRVILAGFKLAIARNSFVYHFGSMTFKENKISHIEFMERNRKRFYRKVQRVSSGLKSPRQKATEIKISVIVRTLNRPHQLRNALISLSNQIYRNFETVIVNDGGEDITELLNVFEVHYPIRYIHNEVSKGRSAALNIGIENSKGEWIAFLDDDDIVYPWHLDALMSRAEKIPEGFFFYSDYNRSILKSSNEKYPLTTVGTEPWDYNPQELMIQNRIPIHTWFISRTCFVQVGKFLDDQDMLEDYEFLLRLSKSCYFHHVSNFTCEYRYYLDGANSMARQRSKTLEALKLIYNQNPVDDEGMKIKRKMELDSLVKQIKKIQSLNEMIDEQPELITDINRRIISLITGM